MAYLAYFWSAPAISRENGLQFEAISKIILENISRGSRGSMLPLLQKCHCVPKVGLGRKKARKFEQGFSLGSTTSLLARWADSRDTWASAVAIGEGLAVENPTDKWGDSRDTWASAATIGEGLAVVNKSYRKADAIAEEEEEEKEEQ